MKPRLIQRIDYWVGIPIVFLLTIWRYIILLFSKTKNKITPTTKIIFIKFTEQGSTVLAYAAIEKAREMVGENNVYFWAFSENAEILNILKVLPKSNIYTIRNQGLLRTSVEIIKKIFIIRKQKISTSIDLEFFSRSSAILAYCIGAKQRVGYHRYQSEIVYRGDLMSHRIQYNPYQHTSLAYFLLVVSLQYKPNIVPFPKIELKSIQIQQPEIEINPKDVMYVKSIIDKQRKCEVIAPIIIFNPNAGDAIPQRKWDSENFVLLSKKLVEHYRNNFCLIITGSHNEITHCDELYNKIDLPNSINFAGKTNLHQLIALYSIADVLVTNDSGPGQFASLTNIRNIVLFGPETSVLFKPLGKNTYCIESDLSCRPCINPYNHRLPRCANNRCMQAITVDSVFQKIIEITADISDVNSISTYKTC